MAKPCYFPRCHSLQPTAHWYHWHIIGTRLLLISSMRCCCLGPAFRRMAGGGTAGIFSHRRRRCNPVCPAAAFGPCLPEQLRQALRAQRTKSTNRRRCYHLQHLPEIRDQFHANKEETTTLLLPRHVNTCTMTMALGEEGRTATISLPVYKAHRLRARRTIGGMRF